MVTEKKKKDFLVPKFAMDDGYVSRNTSNLKGFIKTVYGLNLQFYSIIFKKFERLKGLGGIEKDLMDKVPLKYFRMFIIHNKDFRYRYYAHLYFIMSLKIYRFYRHIRGLPSRGQRTWSNANTPFRQNTEIKKLFAIQA